MQLGLFCRSAKKKWHDVIRYKALIGSSFASIDMVAISSSCKQLGDSKEQYREVAVEVARIHVMAKDNLKRRHPSPACAVEYQNTL